MVGGERLATMPGMVRVWRHQFRRTTLLLLGCTAFVGGIGLAHAGFATDTVWCLVFGAVAAFGLYKKTWWALVAIVLFGVAAGSIRGGIFQQKLAVNNQVYYHKITIRAIAKEDGVYGSNTQMTFDAGEVIVLETGQHLAGKISLSGFGLNAVYQGDEMQATGKLYPSLGSYQGRISYAQLQLIAHHDSLVSELRRKFTAGMQSALPEPLASFAMGLLIGQRASLPDTIKQDLLMVGLTHIIAVSGYNLTIMLRASKGVFGKRSKRIATLLSFGLIAIFLLFAGTSASIVRAAIVSGLSIATSYYGRQMKPLLLIMLAATITAFVNPFYVWSDASWYLSFLAFYGVMVLGPLIQARWPGRWHESPVVAVALESLCAEAMTLPYVLFVFGQMSFIGLLANMLVVALVPLGMLLAMIAGLAGMLAGAVSGWLAWPARLLLTYMLDVAHLLASIPHIFIENQFLSLGEMLFCYLLVCTLTLALWSKTRKKRIITDTNETYRASLNGAIRD